MIFGAADLLEPTANAGTISNSGQKLFHVCFEYAPNPGNNLQMQGKFLAFRLRYLAKEFKSRA
jgi:hypothetical protein